MAERLSTGGPPRPVGDPAVSSQAEASGDRSALVIWKARLSRLEHAVNRRTSSPRAKRALLIVALALFIVISVFSFESLRGGIHFHLWAFLVLAGVATPLTVAVNAAEYRAVGAVAGHRIRWPAALRLTVLSIAANLLPLPGGLMIRTQALRQEGSTYKRALFANAAAGIAWIAMGCLAIGVLFISDAGHRIAGVVLVALAVAVVVGLSRALRKNSPSHATAHLLRLLVVELITVGVSAISIALGFEMIGFDVRPVQAVALAGSVIISTAIGIFPAGLGLRELLAGAIGAVVDLRAVTAVAAVAAERVAILLGMALASAILLVGLRPKYDLREKLTDAAEDPLARPDLP